MANLLTTSLIVWTICFVQCIHWWCTSERGATRLWNHLRSRGAGVLRSILAIAAGVVVVFVISPFLLVTTTVEACREAVREGRLRSRLLREHQELLYRPMDSAELPVSLRRKFDRLADDLAALEYHALGDFVMKEQPPGYYARVLLSDDGTTIGFVMRMFDTMAYGFVSVLDGGRVLETSSLDECRDLSWAVGHDQFRGVFGGDQSIDQIELLHHDALEAFIAETGAPVLQFDADQVGDVLRYEHRLYSQLKYERGERDAPPEPELPAGRPMPR
ncbi:hypothetical protein [Aeoliella sp.]|uniref:hypothetical protein n=1 Tax=Aeoliella sp. TaxID=2795800 RepID=UPI003CCBB0B4